MKNVNTEIYELFKVCKVDESQFITDGGPYLGLLDHGLVLDFIPNTEQQNALKTYNKPIDINTFFSHDERYNSNPFDLITKQILHYIEIYGFGEPGEFSQLSYEGTILPVKIVRGVTKSVLDCMIQNILYSNAPIKDAEAFERIVRKENVSYDVNEIQNNELRVRLFSSDQKFESGDDAVRWIVYQTTGATDLIKSKEVISAVTMYRHNITSQFLSMHEKVLAQVFNRHKRIILAVKTPDNKTVINRITRASKTQHKPIVEAINKTYIAKALNHKVDPGVLDHVSLRDKFKFLNVLSWKKEQKRFDAYLIRNGKVHLDQNRKVYGMGDIERVEQDVLDSIRKDLTERLSDKTILLDENVDYGLPTSRNQTLGNLPFGTRVSIRDKKISSGIYWKNSWGANDLDLSSVDMNGRRIGWASYRAYTDRDVVFSGDVTNAPDPLGAMEFMTSAKETYGLFVNVFSGQTPCGVEIVVGSEGKNSWIDDVMIREKHQLKSRGEIVGFVQEKDFVVYHGRMNNKISNFGENPIVQKAIVNIWTVKKLFAAVGIDYTTQQQPQGADYDLRYENFSFDKLEGLFGNK